jgi:molybdenum cofactor biosynthesis enzyme MoaA
VVGFVCSLDTLDPFKFEIMTRRSGHDAVLRSLEVALAEPLQSVKLNVVVVKGLNDSEVLDFVHMTRDKALSIRFIEFMPFTGLSSNHIRTLFSLCLSC